jgi:recombination protein RecA
VRVTKNKVAPPFRKAEFDIMYNEGISRVGDVLDIGVELGVIEKRGSYYYYEDYQEDNLAQGRENVKDFLRENPEVAGEIEQRIRETIDLPASQPLADGETDSDSAQGET